MKILLDNGAPHDAVLLLTDLGHDVVHVLDIGFDRATDRAIVEHAVLQRRLLITFDSDFHAILARGKARTPSVVRMRIEGLTPSQFVSRVIEALSRFEAQLITGAALTITSDDIRCRLLPLS